MRISSKLVGVGVLALMTGCSTLNSLNPFASDKKGDQPAKLVELKGSMAVRTAWKLDIGKAKGYQFSPALSGNTLVVAAADGAIARVDAATGKQLWRVKADSDLSAGVGTD
ncbi:MAG: outer membrane protein assembly factor BamB, partial [Oxalobacteraceae bacterium]